MESTQNVGETYSNSIGQVTIEFARLEFILGMCVGQNKPNANFPKNRTYVRTFLLTSPEHPCYIVP